MARVTIHEKAEYLSDVVFAASDGIVTTFAIVAGSAGASLSAEVVLILGFANLFADGFSMASGNYLGVKSEIEYEEVQGKKNEEGSPLKHGLFTFVSFNLAGFVPLMSFVFGLENPFVVSTILVGLALFVVGFLKTIYTRKSLLKSGIETFTIGGFAAFVAFLIGFLIEKYVV